MTQLRVDKIESNTGFTILQDKQIYIPNTYNYSLHIIDLNQIDELITELTNSISLFPNFIATKFRNYKTN